MPITAKTQPERKLHLTGNYPTKLPRVPESVLKRFGEMKDYEREMDRVYGVLIGLLQDRDEQIAELLNANAAAIADGD